MAKNNKPCFSLFYLTKLIKKPKLKHYGHLKTGGKCVVPENIHTPTTEGIENSEGEGGVKDSGNSRGVGGGMIDLVSRGLLIQYVFECRSSCSKIISYLLSRTFT